LSLPGVLAARVASEKPDIYVDCAAVGFEVFALNKNSPSAE
jgi:hypothetical protein